MLKAMTRSDMLDDNDAAGNVLVWEDSESDDDTPILPPPPSFPRLSGSGLVPLELGLGSVLPATHGATATGGARC